MYDILSNDVLIVARIFVKLPLKINETKITRHFSILQQMSGTLPNKQYPYLIIVFAN
jgi:hypothetical protein